jgi:hypothetical protein
MLGSFFITLAGLVGAGGGAGVLALFVPSVASALRAALDFLRSPLGTLLGGLALSAILYVAGYVGGDVHGTRETRAEWAADVAAKAKAADARETALRLEMRRLVEPVLADDETFGKTIEQKVTHDVAQNSADPCRRATGADIGRLLSIR